MATLKQECKVAQLRKELREKYFAFPISLSKNFEIISLLSDTQEVIAQASSIDGARKEHYREILNDIKRILIAEDVSMLK